MSRDQAKERAIRARPVFDPAVQELLGDAEALSRRWAIVLVLARPLAEMAEVPLEDLAREGPPLCEWLIGALGSEQELERLSGETGDARMAGFSALLGRLVDPDRPTAVVEHVEALRGVFWEALLEQLHQPSPRLVADLSDRLAFVCSCLLAGWLAKADLAAVQAPRVTPTVPAGRGRPPEPAQVLYSAPPRSHGKSGAVLIDEHQDAPGGAPRSTPAAPPEPRPERVAQTTPAGARTAPVGAEPGPARAEFGALQAEHRAARTAPRPLPWDTPLQHAQRASRPAGQGRPGEDPRVADRGEGVMRVSRGPGTPDRRSS